MNGHDILNILWLYQSSNLWFCIILIEVVISEFGIYVGSEGEHTLSQWFHQFQGL